MHPHDEAIERYQALQPQHFPYLLRIDLREQYSWDILENEALLQLWLRAENEDEEKPFLHLSFYGALFSLGAHSHGLWPSSYQTRLFRIRSIRDWQYEDLKFEVSSYDSSYNDYNEEFKCRRFEVSLEGYSVLDNPK